MLLIVNICTSVLRVEVDKNLVVTNAIKVKPSLQRRLSDGIVLLFLMKLYRINQKTGFSAIFRGFSCRVYQTTLAQAPDKPAPRASAIDLTP